MNCARVRCRRWGRATPCLELPLLQDAPRCARGTGLADRTASPKQIPRYQARGFAKEWRQKGFSLSFFPSLGQFSPSFVWSCAGFLSSGPCPSRATECSRRSCRDTHQTRSSSPPSTGHASIFLGNSTGPRPAESFHTSTCSNLVLPSGSSQELGCWVQARRNARTCSSTAARAKPNAIGAPSPPRPHVDHP